jgi:hypothetical protein
MVKWGTPVVNDEPFKRVKSYVKAQRVAKNGGLLHG